MNKIISTITTLFFLCLVQVAFSQVVLPAEHIYSYVSSLDNGAEKETVLDGQTRNSNVFKTAKNRPGWWKAEFDQSYYVYSIKIHKPRQATDLLVVGGEAPIHSIHPDILMNSPWYDYFHIEATAPDEIILPINKVLSQVMIFGLQDQLSLYEVTIMVDEDPNKQGEASKELCDNYPNGVGYLETYYNENGTICMEFGHADEISVDNGRNWTKIDEETKKYCFELMHASSTQVIARTKEGCKIEIPVTRTDAEQRGTVCSTSGLTFLGKKVNTGVNGSIHNSTISQNRNLTCNNRLDRVLVDGPAIFGEARNMIANADHEVLISFYQWDKGCDATQAMGEGFRQNQINRAGESTPLHVRIIVDRLTINPFSSNPLVDVWNDILSWNLDMSRFNFQLATFNHTLLGNLHDKYMVVDENHVLVTGANPQFKHDSDYHEVNAGFPCNIFPPLAGENMTGPWKDSGYKLTGCVGSSAVSAFNFTWNVDAAHHYICLNFSSWGTLCFEIIQHSNPARNWNPDHETINYGNLHVIGATRKRRTSITNNSVDNPQDQAWLAIINNAQSHINIATPNINDDAFRNAILQAAGRGVTVNLVTGRLFNADANNTIGQGGYNKEVVQDLRNKMKSQFPSKQDNLVIRWYSLDKAIQVLKNGGRAMHAKFMSADGNIAMVGSGNQETQAWNFSQEFNLVLDGSAATAKVDNEFFDPVWGKSNGAYIELYEGNNCTQDISCLESTIYNTHWNYVYIDNCHDKYGNNDEARSAIIYNTPAMKKITIYDESDPGTSPNDDFTEIITLQPITRYELPTFEQSFTDAFVRVIYHADDNLDGKVSCIKIEDYVPDPKVIFYENNYAGGDIVCVVKLNWNSRYINFTQNHPENCTNDEARSIVLQEIPQGRVIRVYDNSRGNGGDDYTRIYVKRFIPYKKINTFEQSFSDADVTVTYQYGGNLDGKVSSMRYGW